MWSLRTLHSKGNKILRTSSKFRRLSVNKYSNQTYKVISEDFVVRGPYDDVKIEEKPEFERVFEISSKWPSHVAMECGETGRRITYGELYRRSRALAAALRSRLRVRERDAVAILLPNCPEYPVVTLATMVAGGVAALINPAYKSSELKHHFVISNPKLIISMPEMYPTILATLNEMQLKTPIMVVDMKKQVPDGAIKYSELSDDPNVDLTVLKSVKVGFNDTAIMPFSSGTTGLPKGVTIPHKALVSSSYICGKPEYTMNRTATENYQDVLHALLPFYHIYGHVSVMLNCLHHGAKMVTLPQFAPELYLKILAEHKSTIMFAVPPIVQFVTKHPLVKPEYLELTRQVICGGAALPAVEVEAFESKHKNTEILLAYGLTETTALGCATARGTRRMRSPDTSGHVFANMAMKVLDIDTQSNLPPGQVGELCVWGPVLMSGYHGNPEQTKACLSEDGWLRTGDIGYYDDNGYFYITERLKELIKVKGFQVAPAELEGILLSHPSVLDVGVVGVLKKDGSSEEPVAFAVLKSGAKGDAEELKQYVAERVTAYKKLASVILVDSIPKTNTGKILRRELKRIYDEGNK